MKKRLNKTLIFLLVINLILYVPSLFEPISYGDECIYLTLGNAFRKGLVFYRDIHDNKPPLLYLLAALANGKLFYFRLLAIIANLTHLALIYLLIKKLTKNKWPPFIGGLIFTVGYLAFEGRIANGEIFMMLPVTLAVYLLISNFKNKNLPLGLIIGLLFAIGFLFKIPVAFDLFGILFATYILTFKKIKFQNLANIFKEKRFWGIIIGFFLPVFISILYYSSRGAFIPYVRSALMQNIGYLSSWQGSELDLIIRGLILILLSLALFLARKKCSYYSLFFGSWFIFALFGALLSGRPYPHYLIEIIPPLSILTALTFTKQRNFFVLLTSYFLILTAYFYFHFWWYPILPYYKNFFSYSSGKISQEQYFSYWGERTKKNYRLAKFIRGTSLPNDRIFIWGDACCVYAISKRLPPGRYTVNYHIFDFNGFKETLRAIKKVKPPIIVKMKNETRIWPELDSFLIKNYYALFLPDLDDQIYLRLNH